MPQNLLHFPLYLFEVFPLTVIKRCASLFSPTSGRQRDASALLREPQHHHSALARPTKVADLPLPPRALSRPEASHRPQHREGSGLRAAERCRRSAGSGRTRRTGLPSKPRQHPWAVPHRRPPPPHRALAEVLTGLGRAARQNGALGPDLRSPARPTGGAGSARTRPRRHYGRAARAPRSPPDAAIPPRSAAAAARERAGHAAARPQRQRGSSGGEESPYLRRCLRGQ